MEPVHRKDAPSPDLASDQVQEKDKGWRSKIVSFLRSFSLEWLGEKVIQAFTLGSRILGFLWLLLPQMLVDIIAIFVIYLVSSLLLKASEAVSLALWGAGTNPLHIHIISLQGQPITPASFLQFFIQLWVVVSLILSLIVNTCRLIRADHQLSEDAE